MDYLAFGFLGLFLVSFLSATLVPLASEGVLILFLAFGYNPVYCILIATLGNTLGSYLNYWLGWLGNTKWLLKLGVNEQQLYRYEKKIAMYGHWLGLLSWVPIIGDPLTLALGFFKTKIYPTLLLILCSKFVRYSMIWILWRMY